jgi:signal transduction histidine kinase/ActR/RegA family two-component response regulator
MHRRPNATVIMKVSAKPQISKLERMHRVRLRTLLAILVLVTTVPVAAFAAWVISRSSVQEQTLIDRQNIEQARAVSDAVDQEYDSVIASLNVLALLEPVDRPDRTLFIQIAARMLPLHSGWQSIRLIDRSFNVIASTAGAADTPLIDRAWADEVIASGGPALSRVVRDPESRQWIVSVGVPVRRDNRLKYVLSARLYAQMFGDILVRQQPPPGGVVTLIDTTPHIIARTRNQEKYVGQAPSTDFVARSRAAPEGSWRSTLLEGTAAYSAWSRSDVTGWTIVVGLPADAIDGPRRRSFNYLITAGSGACCAGLVLALFLGRGLVRAQTTAAAAARALARGDPLPAFHSNIKEVYELSEGLRDAAVILEERLRERDEAQADADRNRAALLDREKSARRAAEALNRSKDEFIATVSHELRTPLNAIFGWVAMLRTGSLDPAKQAHALEVIDRNTRAQAQLIEDLLDMSRVIRGSLRLGMEPIDLSVVLEAAIESLRPTADARQVPIVADAPRGVALVSGDQGRLQQVLWNILSNALKFTPSGGRIDAQVTVDGSEAVVRVTDSGEGIAPEFLPHVFHRFRQENAEVTRTHSGLGLGLSLVHHLVELHGGTIAAESDGKGQGASFTIRLPLLGIAACADGAPPPAITRPSPAVLRDRRILVLGDDDDAREVAAEALEQAGARTAAARTSDEATAEIHARLPDAIVIDVGLSVVSAYDLTRRLRLDPPTAMVPIVALTTYNRAEDREAALAAGFSAYICKPSDPRALVALVAGLIAAADDAVV